jgi:hypothetical protein
MPGITGTLYDEAYDLDVQAEAWYALDLPYATLFDLGVVFLIVTDPTITVVAELRDFDYAESVGLISVAAELRDFDHVAAAQAFSVTAELRDFDYAETVGMIEVAAELRDFDHVA